MLACNKVPSFASSDSAVADIVAHQRSHPASSTVCAVSAAYCLAMTRGAATPASGSFRWAVALAPQVVHDPQQSQCSQVTLTQEWQEMPSAKRWNMYSSTFRRCQVYCAAGEHAVGVGGPCTRAWPAALSNLPSGAHANRARLHQHRYNMQLDANK